MPKVYISIDHQRLFLPKLERLFEEENNLKNWKNPNGKNSDLNGQNCYSFWYIGPKILMDLDKKNPRHKTFSPSVLYPFIFLCIPLYI